MAVSINATRTSSLFNDQDGDGVFDPGDILLVRIRITNAGTDPATGISVTDTLNGITLVPGSVQVTPIAYDDAFNLTGNTPITIGAAQGLLLNDVDPDGAGGNAGLTVTAVDTTGTQGSVSFNADGSFTFTPTTGFVGVTSFKYFITDAQNLGNVTEGIVTLTVTGLVWYVDNTYGGENGTADGSYLKPFTSLTPLNNSGVDPDGAGDTIFVYHNGGNYTAGITLEAGQKLLGDGVGFMVNGHNIGGTERTGGVDNVSTNAVISQNSGTVITLATDNTVRGVTIDSNGAGVVGMADGGGSVTTGGGTLTVDNVDFTGTGQAIDIDAGGNLAITIGTLTSTAATGQGIQLAGTTSSGTGLITGTVTVGGGTISGPGTAVLIGVAGGGTANSGGNVNLTYGGVINGTSGTAVEIQDRTGGTVSFNGNITHSGTTAGGIIIDSLGSGTVNFNGQSTSITTTTGIAVNLTNNSGGTINFTPAGGGNGLDIVAGSGKGLVFTGGGTLTVTGTGNSVATTTGQVLDLQNGAMGTSGIQFATLGASGTVAGGNAVNILNLDAAGVGTFQGGTVTIAGTTGAGVDGINITSSNSTFTFASATIDNTTGDGIEINGQTQTQGAVTFNTVDLDTIGGIGISIAGAQNSVNINGGTIGASNDPAGDGININGGTGNVTVAATINKSTAGDVVDITNKTGGTVTFSADISSTGTSNGIKLTGNTGGTFNFTSNNITLNTGASAALTFTNTNTTGATVSFTGGNLNIDTTTGIGINATNTHTAAGSLTISGNNNVVDKTGSGNSAVFISNVASNVTLLHVNNTVSNSSTPIYVKGNGATGSFVITGTGTTPGSGGTLNGATGADLSTTSGIGIYLENANNVSLSNMNLVGTYQNYGIRGFNDNNFTLLNSTLNGTYGTYDGVGGDDEEGAIKFGTNNDGANGLIGTVLFSGNSIGTVDASNPASGTYDTVGIWNNTTGTLNFTMNDSAANQAVIGKNSLVGSDGVVIQTRGGGVANVTITGVEFKGSRGDMVQGSVQDTGTLNITLTNNIFHNAHGDITSGGGGISITAGGNPTNYNLTYNVSNNSFRGAEGAAIFVSTIGTTGTITGVIANNTIGVNDAGQPPASTSQTTTGSSTANGIDVRNEKFAGSGNLLHAVRIEGNTITDIAASGIYIRSNNQSGGVGRVEATIKNNTIEEVSDFTNGGISVIAGGASGSDIGKLGLAITGNSVNLVTTGADGDNNAILVDQVSASSEIYVPGVDASGNGSRGEAVPPAGGQASTRLSNLWAPTNTLVNGEFPNAPGVFVDAIQVKNLTSNPFVLAVPALAADPNVGKGWEDLLAEQGLASPKPDSSGDTGAQTAGDNSGSTGGTPPADTGSAGGDTAGTAGTGGTGDAGTPAPATPVVDDGVLTLAELSFLVEAAIARWIEAGATPAQVDAMRAVKFGVIDMAGIYVGSSERGVITIDSDGAGYGWFVDSTPGEDSEFEGSGTRLTADAGGAAAGKLDLLTVLMHELGHQIGLTDDYSTGHADELMYGYMNVGERRLPGDGDADGAVPGSVGSTAFALTPVSVGTLPGNKAVDVFFKATINNQTDGFIVNLNNDSTISGTNFSNVVANEQDVVDSLTLGNTVFLDANKNGQFDAGEGVSGVSVSLYVDTNDSGGWDAGDVLLGSQSTLAGGLYSFTGLAPGDYIVVVNASNFNSGQALHGKVSITGGTDPDDNVDNDDNGLAGVAGLGNAIASQTITLAYNTEPDGTPDVDGDADADTNLSLDFGFITPNAAPTSTNLDGDIATYIEGASPVKLDVGGNATLSDPTSADFSGGTLTVAIGAGANTAEDVLSIGTTATVTLDAGNTVKVGGTTIGTYAGGSSGNPLVITLNTSANAANVDDLLQALQYNNTDLVDPSTDTRAVSITLVDGDGTDGGLGTDTLVINTLVNVTAVNDAPDGGAGNSDTTSDSTTLVFTASDFSTGFTDPDNNAFDGIVITSLPSVGTLKLNGTDVTTPQTVTLADLNGGLLTYVPAGGSGGQSPTFDYKVKDNGGVLNGGVDTDPSASTFTINVTASNAAPALDLDANDSTAVGTGFASSYTEGGAAAAIADTDVDITDPDAGDDIVSATITVTSAVAGDTLTVVGALPGSIVLDPSSTATMVKLTGSGTHLQYEAALQQITFSSSSDNPTANGTNTSRSITVVVNDGQANSPAATATVAVTDVNDAPSGTNSTITATEDAFRVLSAADLGFNDADGTFASVTISAATGGKIYFDADGAGGADPVEAVLPQTYTALQLSDGKVSFKANQNLNGTGVGTITFKVTDDDGADAASSNVLTVDVTAVNDSPVLTTGGPIAATEQTAVAILTGASVADVDLDARNGGNGDYAGASFSVNRNPASNTDDVFTLVAGPNFTIDGTNLKTTGGQIFANISANANGLIVINFTSLEATATSALVDEVIQSVRYTNTSDNPPASLDLAIGFSDGSPGGGQGAGATNLDVNLVTVNIAGVNDAPVNSLGGTIGTSEDAVDASLTGMSISDPDANAATDDIVVTFDVGNGTLDIRTDVAGGVTASDVTGDDTGTIVVTATLNQINATLAASNGLTYSPDANFNGDDTLTVTTNDQGHNGSDPGLTGDGGSEQDIDTRTISVSAVNDPPVAQPDAISTPENVIGTGSLFANNGSGADSDLEGDTFTISAVNGSGANVGTQINLASGAKLTVNADGSYSYDPNGKFNRLTDNTSGAVNTSTVGDTFQYTVSGGNTVTVTVTVNGVASAPVNNAPVDWLMGDATHNTITGTALTDQFVVSQGGNDTVSGLAGKDFFYFGGALTPDDVVDGGDDQDTIILQGDYSGGLVLDGDVTNIEGISFLAGSNTAFGNPGTNLYDYVITTADANFAAGLQVRINGSALLAGEDLTFDGSDESNANFVVYGGRGKDTLTGGDGNDIFFFSGDGRFAAGDTVNGGDGYDGLFLRGNYTLDLTQAGFAGAIQNLENMTLSSASDERYARGGGSEFDYDIIWADAGLTAGRTLTVNGALLQANETMKFIGTAETNGNFRLFGGAANDDLRGGSGADLIFGGLGTDTMYGGNGNDVFRYDSTAESTSAGRDGIQDFALGDLVDLSKIDANTLVNGNQAFNFIGSAAFSNTAGELRFGNVAGPIWLVQGDTNGDGVSDFEVLLVINDLHPITSGDFVL
ncbi:MAG TPA: Ig-like domain-containing protein [Allosphingosinicella sp.]|nr:Ig-like domain-containing protein [Allosphingosinicella sp.]